MAASGSTNHEHENNPTATVASWRRAKHAGEYASDLFERKPFFAASARGFNKHRDRGAAATGVSGSATTVDGAGAGASAGGGAATAATAATTPARCRGGGSVVTITYGISCPGSGNDAQAAAGFEGTICRP